MNPFVKYFETHGDTSAPGPYQEVLAGLTGDVAALCGVVQGLVIHPSWAPRYGAAVPAARESAEQQARTVVEVLDNVTRLDAAPLTVPRPPERRAAGTSRHMALLLCSMLRSRGVPARLRCGFAPYVRAGGYEDHWICEHWSTSAGYWLRVDPQLDALQSETLAVDFDPLDVPIERYLYAGEMWVMCRRGRTDPDLCGIRERRGLGVIKGSVVRDILALNKIETLPWDSGWGILGAGLESEVDRGELSYVDRLARCSANSLVHLAHSFFADDDRIRFPEGWDLSMAPTFADVFREKAAEAR